MNLIKIIISGVVLIMIYLMACSPRDTSYPAQLEPEPAPLKEGPKPESITKEAWEIRWEKALKEAKKEGIVVAYSSTAASGLKESSSILKEKFGIKLDIVSGRGAEIRAKLLQERVRGLFIADVSISGLGTFVTAIKPAGAANPLEPALILPEVKDPNLWFGGKLPWGDKDHLVFNFFAYPSPQIAVNTNFIKPEEIKSMYDLLEPKWKGKILMNDPTISGTANKSIGVYGLGIMNMDYFRQLAKQEPYIIRDQRLQVEWLAKGKYALALFPRSVHVAEFQEAGAPLEWVDVKEGTYLSVDGGALALLNKAPHPNAAKVFINWLLSKEGQILMQRHTQQQSARIDLPTEGVDPLHLRKPGAKYFMGTDTEEWYSRQPEWDKAAKEIFGPLLK